MHKKKFSCIVINGKFLEQKITGVQRFAWQVTKELDKIAPQFGKKVYLAISPAAQNANLPELKNIEIKTVGKAKGIIWEQFYLARFINRNKALGLHFCNAVPFLAPKGIAALHDISYKVNPEFVTTTKHKIIRIWHLMQQKACAKKTLAVLTVSEFSRNQISEVYKIPKEKITVVYSGWQHFIRDVTDTPIEEDFPFLHKKSFYYCMATLAKNKNFKWIERAAAHNPDAAFAVAGHLDFKKHAVDFKESEMPKNLHYLGYVSDEQAKRLMKNCKAFLFPSLYEGFGLPPLEAMAMGAPVICSNAASLPEVYKNGAHYIDPYNPEANLDELLKEPVCDPKEILSLYGWDKTAELAAGVVRTLL